MNSKVNINDKIRGSLIAGAMGDALGYEVEFMRRNAILAEYGENGITKFALYSNYSSKNKKRGKIPYRKPSWLRRI